MTDSSMLKYQYDTILDQLILLQLHGESPDCPCSLKGEKPGELGEFCEPKHLRSIVALARETIAMESDGARLDYLENLVLSGSELLGKMVDKLCEKEVDLGDYVTWSREKRKPLEMICYSGFCNLPPQEEEAPVEEIARMFKKKEEPRWCHPVRETETELSKLSRTLGAAKKRITGIQRQLDMPLNICRGQAELLEAVTGVLDPYGSRCRDPETGQWTQSEECGYEPAGITTTALGMDGVTRYEFEFKIISLDKLIISHDPFTFAVNPEYPEELQPRLRGRAATKIQVDKIAANLEPDAVITDFHVIDRGTPIVGPDLVVEAGNGRVMGIIKAAADYPEKYANYKQSMRDRARDYGLSDKDIDSVEEPVLVRVRITDVDRTTFAQEANQAATIAPSAIENARTDAARITMGMLTELVIGENESLEDALRAPKNQAFAKRFLSTLPENVQAALVDAQGYLNRDGVHRMAMAVFVSAFQGDSGLRLAEKAFESVDMDVRNTVNAIARSLGPIARAEALTRSGERDLSLSIGGDLAQTVNVYSAIKRNPALTVEKYLAQEQIFGRELTPFQEGILAVLEEYKRSPRKLADIFTAYAEGVIAAPPPAQAALIPGAEITKEGLWERAVKAPEAQPALMEEVIRMFEKVDGDDSRGLIESGIIGGMMAIASLPDETTDAIARMFQDACERPAARYQYISTFFTETPAETALFASEETKIERKIDAVLAQLQSGIEEIQESANFKAFIDTLARFHHYSLGNIMLITLQRPDASRVAGYRAWQELGRNVVKGERGIMILAPCFPAKPKKEEPEEEEEEGLGPEPSPVYFKVVHVFDIAQTEGKELPMIEVPVISGEETGPLFQDALAFAAKNGIGFSDEPKPELSPDLMGYWSPGENLIWVRPDVPQDQRTKTLLHEEAHALCKMRGARDAEVMAESVAYTVANHFGFDTGVRSFPYVAVWARDMKALKANLEIIRKVSMDMIDGLKHVTELAEIARLFRKGELGEPSKADIIKGIIKHEICFDQIEGEADPIGRRAKELNKMTAEELDKRDRLARVTEYDWDIIITKMVYNALGKPVPAYLGGRLQLLTKEIRDKLPALYSQEEVKDPTVWVKFFTPDAQWTWYGIECSAILDDGTQVEASYADKNLRDVRSRSEEGEVQESTGEDDVQFAEAVSKLAHSFNEAKGLLYNEGSGQSDVARRANDESRVSVPVKARASQSEQSWLREESQSGVGEEDRQSVGEGRNSAPQGRGQDERRAREFGAEGAGPTSGIAHGGQKEARSISGSAEASGQGKGEVRKVVDYLFFGLVVGFDQELGYFSLRELEGVRGPLGLAVERDKWFRPMPLSEVKKLHQHEAGAMLQERIWKGPAYRSETGYRHDPGQTAGDVVRYEQESLGNDYGIGEERLKYLDRFPAQAIKWVSKSKRVAAHYNGASPVNVEGHVIIAEDGDGGYLVLDSGRESKAELGEFTFPGQLFPAVLTGLGLNIGFRTIDWAVKKFKEDQAKKLQPYTGADGEGVDPGAEQITGGTMAQAKRLVEEVRIPKEVDIFETTIAKHYRSTGDFHDGSIRVVKPEKDILVYLGCLKSDSWDQEADLCDPNPTVLKTIVPNNKKYREELEHLQLVHPEIKVNQHEGDKELQMVAEALENATEV